MKFSEHIKSQREELKLSQSEVAKQLSVTRQTISNWENGKSYPSIEMLIKVSEVYQVSIDSLLSEDLHMQKYLSRKRIIVYFNLLTLSTFYVIGFLLLLMPSFHTNDLWIKLSAGGLFIATLGLVIALGTFLIYIRQNSMLTNHNKKLYFIGVAIMVISTVANFIFYRSAPTVFYGKYMLYIIIFSLIIITVIVIRNIYKTLNERQLAEKIKQEIRQV